MSRKVQQSQPGERPVKQAKGIPPRVAAIREFQAAAQAAQSCPEHSPCNPLRHCAARDGKEG